MHLGSVFVRRPMFYAYAKQEYLFLSRHWLGVEIDGG